jgi:NNP family nitrate/nitrite transporter-like MFS transporter
MGINIKFGDLYKAPEINPINRKARAIPFFNPINMYGRVFFFSWFGFMISFWAWYTFPPLVSFPPETAVLCSF